MASKQENMLNFHPNQENANWNSIGLTVPTYLISKDENASVAEDVEKPALFHNVGWNVNWQTNL